MFPKPSSVPLLLHAQIGSASSKRASLLPLRRAPRRRAKKEIEAWRAVVKACVPPLVEQWAVILDVHPKTIAYRNMKSRWGSCQPETGRICFNIRLALYPPECLEYVVVHELCHFLEPNHGPGFHALMDRVMPDWPRARRSSNEPLRCFIKGRLNISV